MATIVPVDEFVTDEWYPGFKPGYKHAPWVIDPLDTFKKSDESAFWYLDFHWSRGLTPLGLIWAEDGYNWGTQLAAENLPLPPGRGITTRLAGTHLYGSSLPVTDEREIGARAKRLEKNLPAFLGDFDNIWAARKAELEDAWDFFRATDLTTMSLPELGQHLVKTRYYHKRSMEIHFEVMYPLLANFLGFYGACAEMGVDLAQIGKFLQGWDTKIMETDRELGRLTAKARAAGLTEVFQSGEPEQLRQTLAAHGGNASAWLTEFDDFLQVYGWRVEGTTDVALASWIEDPTPALGMIRTLLQKDTDHDFEAAAKAAVEEREAAIEAARAGLTKEEQQVFDGGLASCQAANFPWWQDDHNYYMDLKVFLPMRWTCQEISSRVRAQRHDDTIFLFWPELTAVSSGEKQYESFRGLVEDRRQYFDHWAQRRPTMPKVLGTIPENVDDPILIEIFGINPASLKAIEAGTSGGEVSTITGIPAAKGKATGIARVLHQADELHRLAPGDVLVCESTSPNWTPAFAKIAACVCDGGGTLSHAAIVGREYGVPTVTALGIATLLIMDGDEVEVDGNAGTVTILRKSVPSDQEQTAQPVGV